MMMDEFVDPGKRTREKNLRGVLSEYANPALMEQEKGAWEHAVKKKYSKTQEL